MDTMNIPEMIKYLEQTGQIDPNCKTCQELFYPAVREGKQISSVFAPRHKAMASCRSGRYNHCTCDTCF